MTQIVSNASDLIGNTPLLRLHQYEQECGVSAAILGKLESYNPAGSVKDRVARQMLSQAVADGTLRPQTVIVEATSGNTGIGLAAIAAAKGYQLMLTMPDTMSLERRNLLQAYGAKLVLTEGAKGMKGAIQKAEELVQELPDAFLAGQFQNPANPDCHYQTTGPEIWRDTEGNLDVLVCGVGTGGTITGAGRYLKEQNRNLRVVAVEPADSPVLSTGVAGPHKIQGIGAGFVPPILDTSIYDEVICASLEQAVTATRTVARTEGILLGVSSGAALFAATELAKRSDYQGKTIVVVFPDGGERYLSTPLFQSGAELTSC